MTSVETKKAKRRKTKGTVVKPTASSNDSSRENLPKSLMDFPQDESDKERIEQLIDASSEMEPDLSLKLYPRGSNPYYPNCSFCNNGFVEDFSSKTDLESDDHTDETANFIKQLCHSCRESTAKALDRHITFDPSILSTEFNPNVTLMSGLSALHDSKQANGADCECGKCIGGRELSAEYEREMAQLEKYWEDLKDRFQETYKAQTPVLLEEEGQCINRLVHRLCLHDPHQLFLRLESLVREFVMDKRGRLQKQLTQGYKAPETSSQFITQLLGEWNQLRLASQQTSKYLTDLKEHLQKFKITWELHNNHLYQSIVYTDPSIHSSLNVCVEQIRNASSYEAGFPALLHEFHGFQNDMSVTLVVWRECHQLVEAYNEEQKALKVKQKWLKEDWAFFREQRKLLEAQVLKTNRDSLSHSVEQQFTETMKNMLSGTKPSSESAFCSRCKRKRCPCDECSITHLITCGIINQDGFENSGFHFQPETMSSYMVNVTPPSMSSTSSDSNTSSPSPLEAPHVRPLFPYSPDGNDEELQGSNDRDSQSEGEEEEEEEEDEEEEEEEEDDVPEDDEESFGDADGEEEEEDEEITGEAAEDRLYPASILQFGLPSNPASSSNLNSKPPTSSASQDSCACHHCQAPPCTDSLLSPQPPEDGSCVCSITGISNPFHPQAPKAAGLNLYPHIHGNYLRNHASILQPQLYDLHQPMQAVSPGGSKLPVKLDPNNTSLPEQFFRTYHPSWDPTFEAENQSIPYSTGEDSSMLPPVPLLENLSFVDPHGQAVSSPAGVPSPAVFKPPPASSAPPLLTTTQPTSQAVPLQLTSDLCPLQQSEELLRAHCKNQGPFNYHLLQPTSSLPSLTTSAASLARNKGQTPACPRPLPLGGNAPSQMPKVEAPVQHCKMHSPGMHSRNLASHLPSSQAGPACQGPSPTGSAVLPATSFRKQQQQQHMPIGVPGYCQHPPPSLRPPLIQPGIPPPPSLDHGSAGGAGNVSVGTSTGMCQDPDCDGRHDDNCDSGDDSSSEKSTSTNTSNQKEGKYCDCCYCEFFGHGSPAQAATSKNYPEMRERLRKRLERKKTEKPEVVPKSTTREPSEEGRDFNRDLDEIVKFINGSSKDDSVSGALLDSSSSKARKRARQKQRKAEEARQRELARQKAEEEQRRCLEEEAAKLRAQQEAEKAEQQAAAEVAAAGNKKRKSRHKTSAPKENVEPKSNQISLSANCKPPSPTASPSPTPPAPKPQSLVERATSQLNCPNPNIIKDVMANSSLASKPDTKAAVQQQQLQQQHRQQQQLLQQQQQQQLRQTAKRSKAADSPAKEAPSKASTPQREPAPSGAPAVNGKGSHGGQVNGSSAPLILAPHKAEGGVNKSNNHVAGVGQIKKSQAGSRTCLPMFTHRTPQQLLQNGTSQPSHTKPQPGPGAQLPNPFQSRVSMAAVVPAPPAPVCTEPKRAEAPRVNGVVDTMPPCPPASPTPVDPLPAVATDQQRPDLLRNPCKNRRKGRKKQGEEKRLIDDVFKPRSESDLDGDMDEVEKELEEFKRFCSTPQPPPEQRKKIPVYVNMKDIFSSSKKK